MTSLADVYEGHVGEVQNVRRLYLGTGLFLAGAVLTVVAMLVASTGLPAAFGIQGEFTPNLIAGILAGLGVPAIFLGVSTILPASNQLRATSVVGASIAVLGVALFWHAYPSDWANHGANLTPYVLGVYFLGVMITLGCLFVGIANFKERNSPGGTVSLQVTTKGGETRVVEVDRSSVQSGGLGGIGMLGETPDGEVETQTNRPTSAGTTASSGSTFGANSGTASDGGATDTEISSPLNDRPGASTPRSGPDRISSTASRERFTSGSTTQTGSTRQQENVGDRYCGNCEHFQYVKSSNGMQPYCGYDDEVMDDMDACDEWQPNA